MVFSGNEAVNGGAIRSAFDADIQIDGCRFEDNQAATGGALHVTDSTLTVTDSEFTGNDASDADGGAIWGNEVTLNLSSTDLVDNTARVNGGALFLTEARFSWMPWIRWATGDLWRGWCHADRGRRSLRRQQWHLPRNRALTLGGGLCSRDRFCHISGSSSRGTW